LGLKDVSIFAARIFLRGVLAVGGLRRLKFGVFTNVWAMAIQFQNPVISTILLDADATLNQRNQRAYWA